MTGTPDGAPVRPVRRCIDTAAELACVPNLTVVQFRGKALQGNSRLVWQLDEEWFNPGSTESVPSTRFPPEAFPAFVLWSPGDDEPEEPQLATASSKLDLSNDSSLRR